MKTAIGLAALAAVVVHVGANAQTNSPLGVWLTQQGDAHVRVAPCDDALCGTIIWLKDPIDPDTGRPILDKFNPDPSRRNNPVLGLRIMYDMRPNGRDRWSGHFYNSDDGKTYAGNLVLLGPTSVKAEGCWFAICMGETWRRVDVTPPPPAKQKN